MSMPWNHSKSSCQQISPTSVVLQRRMNQTKLKQVRTASSPLQPCQGIRSRGCKRWRRWRRSRTSRPPETTPYWLRAEQRAAVGSRRRLGAKERDVGVSIVLGMFLWVFLFYRGTHPLKARPPWGAWRALLHFSPPRPATRRHNSTETAFLRASRTTPKREATRCPAHYC